MGKYWVFAAILVALALSIAHFVFLFSGQYGLARVCLIASGLVLLISGIAVSRKSAGKQNPRDGEPGAT